MPREPRCACKEMGARREAPGGLHYAQDSQRHRHSFQTQPYGAAVPFPSFRPRPGGMLRLQSNYGPNLSAQFWWLAITHTALK